MGLPHRILAILDRAPSEQDPRDVVIEQQDREIGRLRDDLARHKDVHRQNDGLQRQNERLRRENEHLKKQLGAERRAGRRQAAPFAKDRPQGRGGRPGRRPGARYGRQGRRPCPGARRRGLGGTGADHLSGLRRRGRSDRRGGTVSGRPSPGAPAGAPLRHRGRPLLAVSAAGPRAATRCRHPTRWGRPAHSSAPVWSRWSSSCTPAAACRWPRSPTCCRPRFGLHVTPGGLQHLLHHAARDARPAYEELREQVQNAPVVTADETGWRVGAVGHWLWAAVTPTTTVYAICAGRGFDDAQAVLGADFDGVLVRDGWVVYRRYTNGEHQSCLQHLLRRCEHLLEDHPHCGWAGQVQDTLQAGLALRDRRNAGELSEHGLATARGRLLARLSRLIDNPPPLDDAERFAAHLAREFPALFTFLWDPSVDATNWRAEQAIRPAVVIRKVCGGNRTRKGADTQQVLASVVRTARQRKLDLTALFATMLRAPEPIVPDVFGLPPPAASVQHRNERIDARPTRG